MLLRDLMYDSNGKVKPTRLSALLNAALGYVAEQTDGFIDFDAVPQDGASIQVTHQRAHMKEHHNSCHVHRHKEMFCCWHSITDRARVLIVK